MQVVHLLKLRIVRGCTLFSLLPPIIIHMNFYHISLLLLVVLSAYSEGPQHAKSPEPTVCSNSSISLGVLAPILPQNEEFKFVLPQNEVYISVLPQNEVFVSVLLQIWVFEMGLVQTEINTTVLFRIATVNYCQWFNLSSILC